MYANIKTNKVTCKRDVILQENQIIQFITQRLGDLKAKNIVILDVKGKSSITDYMIISTGNSSKHATSVADYLMEEAKKSGLFFLASKGQNDTDWIIVDFNTVIVHIMQEDSRILYELEKLWS